MNPATILGRLDEVLVTGANDVFVVKSDDGRGIAFPGDRLSREEGGPRKRSDPGGTPGVGLNTCPIRKNTGWVSTW